MAWVILLGTAGAWWGGAGAAEPAEPKKEGPETHLLKPGVLKAKVALDAVLESGRMEPIMVDPKVWADLTILEAVAHGQSVRKGEVLVRLDTEKILEQIRDLEQSLESGEVDMAVAAVELENLRQSTPLKLEAARRAQERANDDYAYFEETGREQKEKAITFSLKGAEQRLEGAQEELDQLEKMYAADDLTEETEEIVLKRQRYAVENAQYMLETTKLGAERSLGVLIPREWEDLKAQRRNAELAWELAEQTLPAALKQKELAWAKMQRDRKKNEEKLVDLRKDLDQLTVRAPLDGLVYYGACEEGKWTTGAAVAKKLKPGGKLAPKEIFMTVVEPDRLRAQTVVAEKDLARLELGQAGKLSAVAYPGRDVEVSLDELAAVPRPEGGFPALLSLRVPEGLRLVPGMTAKVTFERSRPSNHVLAPKSAIFTEEDQSVVYLAQGEEEPPAKRVVVTGESNETMVELVEGVAEGDRILLKKPEQASK